MVRWVKLKEFDLSVDTYVAPTDDYLSRCDGSLEKADYRVRTDSWGFLRTGEPSYDKDRIIILGDSSAACVFISESDRLGAVIERSLRSSGRNADVLVGATSDCTTLHSLNIFLNKCIPLRPTKLVLMSCGSDSAALCAHAGYWLNDPSGALTPIAQHDKGSDELVLERPNASERVLLLRVLHAAAQAYGTELVLVTVPHRRRADDYLSSYYKGDLRYHHRLTGMKQDINSATRRFAHDKGVICIDAEMLSDDGSIFYDIVHLNHRGCRIVGELIAERLLDDAALRGSA